MAMLRAIVSCLARLSHNHPFSWDIGNTLAQKYVRFSLSIFIGCGRSALLSSFQLTLDLCDTLLSLSRRPDFWRSPVTEENQ